MMVKHMVLADYTIFTVVSQYHIYIAYLIMHVLYGIGQSHHFYYS
jgi:hypothetical protein